MAGVYEGVQLDDNHKSGDLKLRSTVIGGLNFRVI